MNKKGTHPRLVGLYESPAQPGSFSISMLFRDYYGHSTVHLELSRNSSYGQIAAELRALAQEFDRAESLAK